MKYRQDGVDQWQWLARGKRPDAASPARSEVILNIDYINSTTAEDYTVPGSTKVSHLPTLTMKKEKKERKLACLERVFDSTAVWTLRLID